MRDPVADVLRQRSTLDRGAGPAIVVSFLLHGALSVLAIYAATHATAPQAVKMVSIQFASVAPQTPAMTQPKAAAPKPPKPRIEEPKPIVEEKPQPKPPKIEKNTVPLSPFGRSTKKGSETPPPPKPAETPPAAGPAGTTTDVPIGMSGVTGLEGGDFPYTLYLQGMQRKIGTNWLRPQIANMVTVIYFRIERDGTISETRVETSSGNSTFDRAALSAVRSSSPFNPLPFGYSGTFLGVHLTFR